MLPGDSNGQLSLRSTLISSLMQTNYFLHPFSSHLFCNSAEGGFKYIYSVLYFFVGWFHRVEKHRSIANAGSF